MARTNLELCEALMRADTEAEVVQLLVEEGYWDDSSHWRYLGDTEGNYSTIGNQQSEAIAALIEKIINGVDSRLMNACWMAGINPESREAPKSIEAAAELFFGGKGGGRISNWNESKTTAEGRLLTVAATGHMPNEGMPSISIADQGEGQEPDEFPNTFMSLSRTNKMRVHFVQGKFNMGGTGALQFCSSDHNLQFILSRRNPALVSSTAPARAHEWGFTLVRRTLPEGARSSVFTYLAPVGVTQGGDGNVLSFSAASFPIFPEADGKVRDAYARKSEYGSLVKLYEYEWQGTRSNIVSSGNGLLRRLDVGLPELALPVRLFECRPGYKGHSGSFATNVLGISARLQLNKGDNVEEEFPVGNVVNIDGCPVKINIYAFKKGKAGDYRTSRHGVVFAVNGQAHASFPIDFFRRNSVGMAYLADSLMVLVDCSAIDGHMREDLFMNSRDRLRDTPLARRLEQEIELLVKNDPVLRALRNRRREQELSEKLSDSKPLADVLEGILKNSPSLAKLFLQGIKLTSPFPPSGGAGPGASGEFHGKTYPTFFRFKGHQDGEQLNRDAHRGTRVRIQLETDAEDEYFTRYLDAGVIRLIHVSTDEEEEVFNWTMRGPRSGTASITLGAIADDAEIGSVQHYRLETTDPSRVDAFVNQFSLRIQPATVSGGGGGGRTSTANSGTGSSGGSSSLQLPNIVEVEESEWESRGFTESTALRVISAGQQDDGDTTDSNAPQVYDFFVNVDNKYLRIIQKESKQEPSLLRAKFVYSLVLIGLALLQQATSSEQLEKEAQEASAGQGIEDLVDKATTAIAPILLPMLESIGALEIEDD